MDKYWEDLIRRHGRNLLFLDTSAILSTFETGDENELFETLVGYNLVTSTYVVAETVRRLVKAKAGAKFRGPAGETSVALARFLLKSWLKEYAVRVICIPEEVFERICQDYHSTNKVQCDLTDLVSHTIIRGLQQNQIASSDGHFRDFGLICLPGDSEHATVA